jgi:hypothetical protein
VVAHELAHVVHQADADRNPTLSSAELEGEAVRGAELTVGGAAPGSVQNWSWPWEEEEERKEADPELVQRLVRELKTDRDAWKQHLGDPMSEQVLRNHSAIRHSYEGDPEFQKWIKDPRYRPAGATPAARAPAKWTPEQETRRQSVAAEVATKEAASKKQPQVAPSPRPNRDWAKQQAAMTSEERAKAGSVEGVSPRVRAEAAKTPIPYYIGNYEQMLLDFEQPFKYVPMVRAAIPLNRAIYGRDIINRPADRLKALGEAGTDVVLDASLFLGPESLMEMGVAPEETLAEAAMSKDVTGTTTGMTRELEQNIAERGVELGPQQPAMKDVFEPTATPTSEIPSEAEARAQTFEHSDIVDPGRQPRGFESGRASPGRPVKPGTLEDLESTAYKRARTPRSRGITRADQLEGFPLTKESEAARAQFDKVRDGYAKALNVDAGGNVHHAIELQVLDRYPGVYSADELNTLSNMRGISSAENPELHLSLIRKSWDHYYEQLDQILLREGLEPGMPQYNARVRGYLEAGRDKIDFVVRHVFTGAGVP